MLNLEPESFSCPTHGHDLTAHVVDALDEQRPPVAYKKTRGRREFEVAVSCPGDESAAGTHPLMCRGKYWR